MPSAKGVGEPCAREAHARLCVQRRLACSAGVSPAGAGARSPVARIAGRRETEFLKPIDKTILGMGASHQAIAQANAQVTSKMRSPGGRARNRGAKAA
jgi:hypothetical protein